MPIRSATAIPTIAPHRRGPDRPMRRRPPPDPDLRHAARRSVRSPRACSRRTPKSIIVLPVLFEGQVKAVIELASLSDFTELQIAFLEQLTASIGIVLNSIEATMQTEDLLTAVAEARRRAAEPAGRAAADQRAARAEGAAARRAQLRGRAQEPGDRAGPPRGGGEGDRAGAHLALQVGVPGQHEPRAAHAAQLDPDPGPAARRQSRGQPQAPKQIEFARTIHGAGTDLLNLITDILDLSQDRIGHGHRRCRGDLLHQRAGDGGPAVPPPGRVAGPQLRRPGRSRPAAQPIVTDSKRLQQILKNLLSNALKFTAQGSVRLRVLPAQTRLAAGQHGAQPGELGGGLRGHRHRRRHSGREAEDRVRGLPAGRRHAPAASMAAPASASPSAASWPQLLGGELTLRSTPGMGSDLHALPADHVHRPAHGGARSRARAPRRCRRSPCRSSSPTSSPTTATTCSRASRPC